MIVVQDSDENLMTGFLHVLAEMVIFYDDNSCEKCLKSIYSCINVSTDLHLYFVIDLNLARIFLQLLSCLTNFFTLKPPNTLDLCVIGIGYAWFWWFKG